MTVTIVTGAGASAELALPPGKKLLETIRGYLTLESESWNVEGSESAKKLFECVRQNECFGLAADTYFNVANFIAARSVGQASIDDFLSIHRSELNVQQVGKLALAKAIIAAEDASALKFENKFHRPLIPPTKSNWLSQLWVNISRIAGHVDLKHFGPNEFPLKLITFNYDRTIEVFLFHMSKLTFNFSDAQAAKFLTSIEIMRPFGRLGKVTANANGLVLSPAYGDDSLLSWGKEEGKRESIEDLCSGFTTYNEGVPSDRVSRSKAIMATSSEVYLFGMAFHRQNLDALLPDRFNSSTIYATSLGISQAKEEFVEAELKRRGARPTFEPTEAHQLLADLGHSLEEAVYKACQ